MSQPTPERLVAVHEDAAAFYRDQLSAALSALRYLNSRGIIAATAHQPPWTLGYAPRSWTAVHDHLRDLGYTDAELLTAGLVTTSRAGGLIDVFRERVMFPVRRATDGAVIAFTGRDVSDWPGAPKYRNTATTPIYRKRDHLHGLAEIAARAVPPKAVLLVEGPADVVATARLSLDGGQCAAVAPCGTALTSQQITALTTAVPAGTPLVVVLDADAAGRAAADRAYPLLRDWPGPLETVLLPAGTDPAGLVVRGREAAEHYLQTRRLPLAEHLVAQRVAQHRIDEVPGSVAALRDVAPLLADIAAHDTERATRLCTDLAEQLHLDPLTVLEALYPRPDEPPPRPPPLPHSRESIPIRAPRFPDPTATGQEYAVHCPPDGAAAAAAHHDPHTGRVAWAFAEGLTDSPGDRVAARIAAEVAARTAPTVGAHAAITLARTAINTRFSGPGTGNGDASIAVIVSPTPGRPGRLTMAWAGDITAFGADTTWSTPLTANGPVAGSSVRGGPITINYIDRPITRLLLVGKARASWSPETLRDVVEGRRPQQMIERLLDLMPANALAIRFRATAARTAAQSSTVPAHQTETLPAAGSADRRALSRAPSAPPVQRYKRR
ncbi:MULTISPECIES: toprim domain-containing protein [Catenuloplanes]|uniref:DNA primase catalytic core n=1 Tax=Catenuloplanes niger TaxID=587534 RepID=A0AAE3ZLI6_9ACTN|nr:toprim domain-containing protein [Catenuloplanes niger]MDR7320859.1 DNA primase catalytic core [Catenuloplanes niger]